MLRLPFRVRSAILAVDMVTLLTLPMSVSAAQPTVNTFTTKAALPSPDHAPTASPS